MDCTKYETICENYHVQSYPTIIFLNHNSQTLYRGDRSTNSLVAFAERLDGPEVRRVNDCGHLKNLVSQHGLIVVSTESDVSSIFYKKYQELAKTLKSSHWFFHYPKNCKNLVEVDNLYLLKEHLNRPIQYLKQDKDTEEDLSQSLKKWIVQESFPVYGAINSMNFERVISSGKTLVVAVLDEYKPAKKFSHSSKEFNRLFEKIARKNSQQENKFLFGWSSDLELIQSIVIGHVPIPNVIIINPDLTYYYHVNVSELSGIQDESKFVMPEVLREHSIEKLMIAAKENKLNYQGGNSYFLSILRSIFSNYKTMFNMYTANPLLATILVGLPSVIVIFVIYTTCCYEGSSMDERDDEEAEDADDEAEDQHLLSNHVKQD